jgi:nitrate/nitrite transport system permease protein
VWQILSVTVAQELPSPGKTWADSKEYVLKPFDKRGEMDQGILRFTWYSLILVAKGYAIALLVGTPIGFLLGLSKTFTSVFDPIIQILRPVSPLAWLPLGLVVFQKSEPAAIFTIALCAMWPTVINTAVGVRGISQDYLNVGRVLKLSRFKMMTKIIIPASLPYVFTGYRLSLGLAWLVIVAAEMLTGTPGVGGFLWQEYNSLVYSHIILSVITIGAIGFVLDRLMGVVEARFKRA